MKCVFQIVVLLFLFNSCTGDIDSKEFTPKNGGFEVQDDFVEAKEGSYEESKLNGTTNSFAFTAGLGSTSGTKPTTKKKKRPIQKIIYSADMRFQVKNVIESTEDVKNVCEKYGAHISKMNLQSETYRVSNVIQIRVDESSYSKMIEDFKNSSVHLDELNMKANDVTAEFIDIQSRLNTKKASRDRYIDVLQTKAGTVEEIINAEEAIRRLTEEIEAKEGRLRYLRDKVIFSTITLNIYEVIHEPATVKFVTPYFDKVKDGFSNGWDFLVKLSLVLINIWPLMLIASVLIWKRKWIGKKLSIKGIKYK
jgi:hypothetical protein